MSKRSWVAVLAVVLGITGCGSSGGAGAGSGALRPHPQVIEPTAGDQGFVVSANEPVGDPHAHAPPLSQIRAELKLSVVAAAVTSAGYIDPLLYVNHWERTDQGVDANMPVGAPIVAPGPVKILAIEPNWYAGQPLVYFELLNGQWAGHLQYVAEEIKDIARPGSILPQGAVIARYAASGTGIEYGWSTTNGITLAQATTGYEEGQVTPAGVWMRRWLNSLGANAGPS